MGKSRKPTESKENSDLGNKRVWAVLITFAVLYVMGRVYMSSKSEAPVATKEEPAATSVFAQKEKAEKPAAKPAAPKPKSDGVKINIPKKGTPRKDVFASLGKPVAKNKFKMNECCGNFTKPLLKTYPKSNEKNDKVTIRGYTWDYPKNNKLSVWFHKVKGEGWVVHHARRWKS